MKKGWIAPLLVVVVLLAGGLLGWWLWQSRTPAVPRAQQLYEKNCAVCHGSRGDGQGEAAYLLLPKPRNFRAGKFRLVSSQTLQPTQEDIFQVISEGMPGTAMPSWAHLSEADRRALADYVLQLNREGWVDIALRQGDSRAEAEKYADEMIQPGEPFQVPTEPAVTPAGLREGRKFYVTACANCHGQNGEGRTDPTWRTSEGYPSWSRNLRSGVFKGGRDARQLYMRFATGLPGTPMPSQTLTPEQVWRVVQYVQSLSDPAAQEEARIRALDMVAKRVGRLPASPDEAAWEAAPEVRVPLMPLWWHDGYIDAVQVKALHDGERLAFRLEWDDATRDSAGVRQQDFPDGAAVELAASLSPPLFAMGAPGEPVSIWHWKALWDEDKKAFQEEGTTYPNLVADSYYGKQKGWEAGPLDDTTYRPAGDVHNPLAATERPSNVEADRAAGLGTLTAQAAAQQKVQGLSGWKDGKWRLQLVREMGSGAGDVTLAPGQRTSVAFALWDGHAGDRNGQKSVSIWNTLTVE